MARLPDYQQAIIPEPKLRYCLDPDHPSGRHKARVFESALGIGAFETSKLERIIREGIAANDAVYRYTFTQGTERWVVEWTVLGRLGPMRLISAWNIERDQGCPRLVSCYLKKVSR